MSNKSAAQRQKEHSSHSAPLPTGKTSNGSAGSLEPSSDEIRQRAYDLFKRSGSNHGQDLEHWLAAEAELKAERDRNVDPMAGKQS